MKYDVEITARKTITIEAKTPEDAKQKVSEMHLELNDFDWEFDIY